MIDKQKSIESLKVFFLWRSTGLNRSGPQGQHQHFGVKLFLIPSRVFLLLLNISFRFLPPRKRREMHKMYYLEGPRSQKVPPLFVSIDKDETHVRPGQNKRGGLSTRFERGGKRYEAGHQHVVSQGQGKRSMKVSLSYCIHYGSSYL